MKITINTMTQKEVEVELPYYYSTYESDCGYRTTHYLAIYPDETVIRIETGGTGGKIEDVDRFKITIDKVSGEIIRNYELCPYSHIGKKEFNKVMRIVKEKIHRAL